MDVKEYTLYGNIKDDLGANKIYYCVKCNLNIKKIIIDVEIYS